MKRFLIIVSLMFYAGLLMGQNATISGYVKDVNTGEALIGANIYESQLKTGTVSNEYGFYSITLPMDSVHLKATYVGYEGMEYHLKLEEDIQLPIQLGADMELGEVVVTATKADFKESQMSAVNIPMQKVKALPVLLGEQDIIKTIQLFPGIQSGSEGSSGLYVRGGGPDQNLILLDGVPIYNASHLFGFFSVFNADAINNAKIIKGGFPAQYGGRLSSVLDIRMKEGNMKKISGEGSIGLLSSKLAIEGPIIKDKTSFIVSGRRTYIDVLGALFTSGFGKDGGEGKEEDGGKGGGSNSSSGGYYFWDLNAKFNHIFSPTSRLYVSGYYGKDRFSNNTTTNFSSEGNQNEQSIDNDLNWGNAITAVRWNKVLGPKLFMNVTGTYSQYQFHTGFEQEFSVSGADTSALSRLTSDYDSGIRDWAAKADFQFNPNPRHSIRFGLGNTYHTFIPGVDQQESTQNDSTTVDSNYSNQNLYSHEHAVYFEDDWEISERLKINYGVHFAGFLTGDTWYPSIQPRFSGRFLLTENSSVKLSYSRMTQFLHLLTNPTIGLPTDLWVPATERIAPEYSNQYAIGYAQSFKNGLQFSIEGYYKDMSNLIEYREGVSFRGTSEDWQDLVVIGDGESYGAEFLIEKKTGKTTGWIGYTLSWSNRTFDDLNFGETFPYTYDRRHDIGLAITHQFNDNVDVGLVWVFGTGYPTTLAQQTYNGIDGVVGGSDPNFTPIEYIQERNNYRIPSYHRLDLSVNLHKQKKHFERTWSFGLYNAYSRQNPFYLYFDYDTGNGKGKEEIDEDNPPSRALYQLSLFPLLPSISYSIKF